MSEASHTQPGRTQHVANIIRRDGVYHLLMLVENRWLDTGITSRSFQEITDIADREFEMVYVNAPLAIGPADARAMSQAA